MKMAKKLLGGWVQVDPRTAGMILIWMGVVLMIVYGAVRGMGMRETSEVVVYIGVGVVVVGGYLLAAGVGDRD